MRKSTLEAIKAIAGADGSIQPAHLSAIIAVCENPSGKIKMINAKEAMEILGCSRPTLRAWVKQGKLSETKLSSRKTRFAKAEVETLAIGGKSE